MNKRIIAGIAALVFTLSGGGTAVGEVLDLRIDVAASAASTGMCGENVSWVLDDEGTLTISGNGEMDDFLYSSAPWSGNKSKIQKIVINYGITSIGNYAFVDCRSLKSITIPNSVTFIGGCAFVGCTSLTSITIPNSVTNIGERAFNNCRNLTSITIPNSVISIGDSAFSITSLTSITIPDSVTSIGGFAFSNCSNLTSITIPNSVTSIGSYAFGYKSKIKIDGFKIFCYKNTAGEKYAKNNGFSYELLHDLDKNIGDCDLSLSSYSFIYDGTAKCPAVTVNDGTITLTEGTDYSLSYENNINIGTASVIITGKGYYSDTITKYFSILVKPIDDLDFRADPVELLYDGTEKCPTFTLKHGKKVLTEGTDYSVSYKNNVNAGTATLTITGQGNYSGELNKNFSIGAKSISETAVTLNSSSCVYDGTAKKPTVTVKDGMKTLTEGTDYYISYKNNVNVGTATLTIIGKGNYSGSVIRNFTIVEKSISGAAVTLGTTSYVYDGTAKKPTVTVKDGTKTLVGGTDYTVSYQNNTNPGTATVTVTGTGNYSGYTTKTFTIKQPAKSISSCTVSMSSSSFVADGTPKCPTVTVKDGTKTLSLNIDYNVDYQNNVEPGTATVAIYGTGNYSGYTTKTFTITKPSAKSISSCTVSLSATSYDYDGTAKKPTVTVKDGTKTLVSGTDYTVTYPTDCTNAGSKTVTITGKGNYTGSVAKTYTIVKQTEKKTFVWGQDNWNFNNSSYQGYFSSGTYRSQINSYYLNRLKNNLSNTEYYNIFSSPYAWLDDSWGGSCYGMSSTTLLAKNGLLPFSAYKSGASKLHDLDYPKKNSLTYPSSSANVSSLITYYQMLQIKDVIQQQYRTVPYYSRETNIQKIIALLDKNSTVLVGFKKDGWGGHAILAYGYEYGSFTKNGVTYQGRIKICDPNCSVSNNDNYYIYFNTSSYNWAIPAYSYANISSAKGAVFNYIGANVSEINDGGYLFSTSGNKIDSYVARIDAAAISNNRSITKVSKSGGNYVNMNNAPGEIIEDYSYVLGGESEGTIGYNIFDADAAYKVSQEEPVEMSLTMDYENCLLTAGSAAGKSVIFDNKGFVSVKGESADYDMSMTFDANYPTDWFTVQVKGSGANDASLKKEADGWVITADILKDVEVRTNNKEVSAYTKFSTNYKKAFIYEVDKNTIGIKVDTDNNGTYETVLDTNAAPQITATPGEGAVRLTWEEVPGAEKYAVCGYISGKWQKLAEGNGTSYLLGGLKAGTEYKVSVIAMRNGKWSNNFSNEIVVAPNASRYPVVTDTEYNEEFHQFRLKWNAVPGAAQYGIAVKLGGKWKIQGYTDKTFFTSPKLTPGSTVEMVICAKVSGEWDISNINARAFKVTVK